MLHVSFVTIKIVLQYLREQFQMTDGAPSEFIGMEISVIV